MRRLPAPPPAAELGGEQYAGRACCYCRTKLTSGAMSAGISRGRLGVHVLDIEVYACPDCVRRSLRVKT
ncbi:hypothetical protein ACLVWQ_17480 (plasmid) [Streptomyces sp. CWNU-52B]|uniref:hypothetical protein n=1 Tax=unclassified Streptomyces TaxID=2593676 RepID=UPI0039C171DC